jgi:hypothetical protein
MLAIWLGPMGGGGVEKGCLIPANGYVNGEGGADEITRFVAQLHRTRRQR